MRTWARMGLCVDEWSASGAEGGNHVRVDTYPEAAAFYDLDLEQLSSPATCCHGACSLSEAWYELPLISSVGDSDDFSMGSRVGVSPFHRPAGG